jgi:hypothetical protein
VGILLQVVGLLADRIDGFRLTIDRGANRVDQLSDLAVVEPPELVA